MEKKYYVYIVSSYNKNAIYIGMTSNLPKRIWEHKNKVADGHTKKYNIDRLVYYEVFDNADEAVKRERNMKDWQREWKDKRINKMNPNWDDLYENICA
jgi:putative endonuclease